MSTYACRKLRTVLRNVQAVLAIELLVAAQAVEWRVGMEIDPCPRTGKAAAAGDDEEIEGGRPLAEADRAWRRAEEEAAAFVACTAPERRPAIAAWLGEGTRAVYLAVREAAGTMLGDRMLDEDIRKVRERIEGGGLTAT
jgi:histidine ammonia-lyase